jgi:hypothetical protein
MLSLSIDQLLWGRAIGRGFPIGKLRQFVPSPLLDVPSLIAKLNVIAAIALDNQLVWAWIVLLPDASPLLEFLFLLLCFLHLIQLSPTSHSAPPQATTTTPSIVKMEKQVTARDNAAALCYVIAFFVSVARFWVRLGSLLSDGAMSATWRDLARSGSQVPGLWVEDFV